MNDATQQSSGQGNQYQTFTQQLGTTQTTYANNNGAIPLFISGLIGIPFVIVFLITLLITGSGKTAIKASAVVILLGLLIGFLILIF